MALLAICIIAYATINYCRATASCDDKSMPQFQCLRDKKCIDQELTCNGRADCADGSDEKAANCTDGCAFNGTLMKAGETGQDLEWWYTCTKSRWLITGCVNNGLRHRENDSFQLITRQGIFWGKCEKLDQYHFMRQPYGCVDAYGRNVEAGKTFLLNQLFWARCLLNRTTTAVPDLGQVAVNEVRWKIDGCSDGTEKIVKDNEEFIWIIDYVRLLGVQIRCRVSKKEQEWPDVLPTACVVSTNETKRAGKMKQSYRLVRDKCYFNDGDQIHFCTITSKVSAPPPEAAGTISTWSNDWLLNVTDNSPEAIAQLKKNGFSECSESTKLQPTLPYASPSSPVATTSQPTGRRTTRKSRPRRDLEMSDWWNSVNKRTARSLTGKLTSRISADAPKDIMIM